MIVYIYIYTFTLQYSWCGLCVVYTHIISGYIYVLVRVHAILNLVVHVMSHTYVEIYICSIQQFNERIIVGSKIIQTMRRSVSFYTYTLLGNATFPMYTLRRVLRFLLTTALIGQPFTDFRRRICTPHLKIVSFQGIPIFSISHSVQQIRKFA